MHSWSTSSAQTNHEQIQSQKIHHGLDLGGKPPPSPLYYVHGHEANTQMLFCLRISVNLEAHNFLCKPPIEVRFKSKL